jgi:hypothetical protein
MPRPDGLLSDEEIITKFYMLNAAIGLSKSGFGYASVGQPSIITRIERGHNLHHKTRKRITESLIAMEMEHTEKLTPEVEAKVRALQAASMEE